MRREDQLNIFIVTNFGTLVDVVNDVIIQAIFEDENFILIEFWGAGGDKN